MDQKELGTKKPHMTPHFLKISNLFQTHCKIKNKHGVESTKGYKCS
jgi:hypothetical protein